MATFTTVEISGLTRGYEATCQIMLRNGIRWLEANPAFSFRVFMSFKGVYGFISPEGDAAGEALQMALSDGLEENTTGAQMHAVIDLLSRIHKRGYQAWVDEVKIEAPERVYETSDEQIKVEFDASMAEWRASINSGKDPMGDLLAKIPKANWIVIDPDNEDSYREGLNKISKLIQE